ncbi:MAG: N-acyl homoserine lactonase family protein [Alicyclobacillaceae bacterium]|nr:N-acyl homoserine lactonase family protein [Alicyclobacillaceae bacterium]
MGELYVDKSTLTYARDFGTKLWIPIWAAAIVGNGLKIVVDTGIHDAQWVNDHIDPCRQADDERMEAALKQAVGWTPDEVDIVINTHLHYDHCGTNPLFRNARFYVHKQEWLHAFNPIPSQRWIYEDTRFLYDSRGVNYFQWQFVDDMAEVAPGIKLIHTPGHSPGQQTVLVNTKEGVLAIAADISNLVENINDGVPPGILSDMAQCYESQAKIRAVADRILPGHDPSIEKYQNSGFPLIRK